jgi:phosphoserine phosphatase
MTPRIKAVILDMDGTIYPLDYTDHVTLKFSNPEFKEDVRKVKSKFRSGEISFPEFMESTAKSLAGLIPKKMEKYVRSTFRKHLFSGVEPSLKELKKEYTLCLMTFNLWPFARAVALGLGFDYFYFTNIELDENKRFTGKLLDKIKNYDEGRREQIMRFSRDSGIACEDMAYVADDLAAVETAGLSIAFNLYNREKEEKMAKGRRYLEMKSFSELPSIIKTHMK